MTPLPDAGRVVIVGAGLAGANVAVTLRERGFAGPIDLCGDEPTRPFGRPPLSKAVLQGTGGLGGWYVRPTGWYEDHGIDFAPDARVARIDADDRTVVLADGRRTTYDRLVLCSGGRPRRLPVAGAHLPGVHVLRTVADCEAIREAAVPGARAVVVGMGFIGCEVAASLRQRGVAVTGVLTGSSPLAAALGDEVGAALTGIHTEQGVELVTDDRVVRLEGDGALERVVTAAGVTVECDLAVVGVGIEPDLAAIAQTRIECDNGVLVDGRCQTSADGVYAAGDVANHLHPLFGRSRVEHYNNAEKMGRAVALSILGEQAPYRYVHSLWSDQYAHKIEYVGHAPVWDRFVVRGSHEDRRFVGFYLRGGVLRAAVGLNRGGDPEQDEDSELRACQELIGRRAAIPAATLADERVDLWGLVAAS